MSTEVDTDTVVDVSTEHVAIEKTFESEEFAVPAIKFEIRSRSDDPVAIRLVDYIPTDFPMDSVGFHPDYENTNWTAYKDHRVQFERVLEPGEALTTVYGIRLDDPDEAPGFLGEPDVYEVDLEEIEADLAPAAGDADDEVEDGTLIDIVSEDSNQVVRDVISGEADTVPGLEDEGEGIEATDGTPDPLAADADADPLGVADGSNPLGELADPIGDDVAEQSSAGSRDPLASGDLGEPSEPDLPPIADDEATEAEILGDEGAVEEPPAPVDPLGEAGADAGSGSGGAESGNDLIEAPVDEGFEADADEGEDSGTVTDAPGIERVGAALAAEIRDGEISDADLRILRRELDFEGTESTNVRIRHLQSRVDDLEAYTEALEAFIDENGTAERIFAEYESEVEGLRGRVDGFESELDGIEFAEEFADVERRFDELEELVGANTTDTSELAAEVESLESDLEADLESVTERLSSIDDTLSERLDALDEELSERLDEFDDDLDARFDAFEEDLAEIRSDIEDVQQWRSQLGSVFGAGAGTGADE